MSKEESTYSIVDYAALVAEQERLALAQAWTSARAAEGEMQRAEATARDAAHRLGVARFEVPPAPRAPGDGATRASVEAYLAGLRARATVLHDKARVAAATIEAGTLMAEAARRIAGPPRAEPVGAVPARWSGDRVEALLVRLAEHAPSEAETATCREIARQLLAVPAGHDGRAEDLATRLRLEVQRAIDAAQRRRADATAATALSDGLRGLDPKSCAEASALLAEVVAGRRALTAEIRSAAEQAAARARVAAEDRHVEGVLREVLREIGYVVEDDPRRPPDGAAARVFRSAALGAAHRLELRIDASSRRVSTEVTRPGFAPTGGHESLLADAAAEREGCIALERVRRAAERRGVVLDLDARATPAAERAAGAPAAAPRAAAAGWTDGTEASGGALRGRTAR